MGWKTSAAVKVPFVFTWQQAPVTGLTVTATAYGPSGSAISGGSVSVAEIGATGIYVVTIASGGVGTNDGVYTVIATTATTPYVDAATLVKEVVVEKSFADLIIPSTGNTAHSANDALNGARAQAFGKWVWSGTTLTLYASDGTTAVRTFTLNDAVAPTSRT